MNQSQQGSGANPISDQIPRGKLVTTSGWVGGSLGWWRCIDIQIILFRPFRTFFGLTLNNFSVVPYRPLPPTSSQALLANQDIWMGSGFQNRSKTLSKSDQQKTHIRYRFSERFGPMLNSSLTLRPATKAVESASLPPPWTQHGPSWADFEQKMYKKTTLNLSKFDLKLFKKIIQTYPKFTD